MSFSKVCERARAVFFVAFSLQELFFKIEFRVSEKTGIDDTKKTKEGFKEEEEEEDK